MNPNISVLFIEDDLVDQMEFVNAVRKMGLPYDCELASTISAARRALMARKFDVIITDFKLPDGNAFDLLDVLIDKLVIFATGSGDEEIAVKAMRLGIRDYLIKDPERNYLKLLPHRIDIARRQWQAEEALRDSENRHRDLVENASDLIHTAATDGRITFANRAWLAALDYTEAEARNLSIFNIIDPESREHCSEIFRSVLQGASVRGFEAVFRAKGGRAIYVEGSVNCRFENGAPVSTRGIFRDITERKTGERERERLIVELRAALDEVKALGGLLPVCAWCKNIRDDKGYWQDVHTYLNLHAEVTHGICPTCQKKEFPDYFAPAGKPPAE